MVQVLKPSTRIEDLIDGVELCKRLEKAGRTCYKSEGSITDNSYRIFLKKLIASHHESVLEHEKVTVRFICDRGVSHELVRQRLCSFSQESTRYCNYSKDKFGNEITVIDIGTIEERDEILQEWYQAMMHAEKHYLRMIELGASPQVARSVLPNSLKTEIVVTANIREWRLVFTQRTAPAAHPQMRELMVPLLETFKATIPILFDDIGAA